MSTREDAHRLVDAVPDDHVVAAVELLRQLVAEREEQPRRAFRFIGAFEGDPDLGARSKEILRQELGEGRHSA